MRSMKEHYGAAKGKQVFYASAHGKGKKWHKSPESYTDTTDFPKKTDGPVYQPEASGGGGGDSRPDTVREYDDLHGSGPKKDVRINESGTEPGTGAISPSVPEDVDKFSDDVGKR